MIDITHKTTTLREATAQAIVKVNKAETIEKLLNNEIPKGNVLESARTAGLFAVKNTHLSIPDCHPIPIEYANVDYELKDLSIKILVTIKTIYKTGVEVEAMHGATIVALTIYDMLKPIDKEIEIHQIRLVKKRGGKSSFTFRNRDLSAAVIVCSDSISAGKKEDRAGKTILNKLSDLTFSNTHYEIIPDELDLIQDRLYHFSEIKNLVIFTGGTGLGPRDVTTQAVIPMLDRRIPGIEEAMRKYGQDRMPYAMLARSVAGLIGDCLVLALPGSTKGAQESMDALFPHLLHIFDVQKAMRHD